MKIKRQCISCKKDFYIFKCQAHKGKTCSRSCYYKSKVRKSVKKCQNCSKIFSIHPYLVKTRKYCSQKCSSDASIKTHDEAKQEFIEAFPSLYTVNENGCWIWKGAMGSDGYGIYCFAAVIKRAHRLAYEFFVGKIPDKKLILHTCDVRKCVAFSTHLRIGTHKENTDDMIKKNRQWWIKIT